MDEQEKTSGAGWRERLAAERRQHILEAAARAFASKGFAQATMKEIAVEAGIAPGTIYLYFKNKEDLLVSLPSLITEATLAEAMVEMGSLQDLASPADLEATLCHLIRNGIQRLTQHIEVFRVLVSSIPVMDEETREGYLRRIPLYFGSALGQIFQTYVEQGIFRDMDLTIVSRALIGMIFFFVLTQEVLPGQRVMPLNYDDVAHEVTRLFLYGVLSRPEGTASFGEEG
jgi:TetR/AcrR family fatty acid metabolism transcriptional regulator